MATTSHTPRRQIVVDNNLRNSISSIAALLLGSAVHLVTSPYKIYKHRQHQQLLNLLEENWKLGYSTAFQQINDNLNQAYHAGINEGFLAGQLNIIKQIQSQTGESGDPPDTDRWKNL